MISLLLLWDSDLAWDPKPLKTPDGSVPQPEEVVLVTASLGTSNFLGIPNLKDNGLRKPHVVGESMGYLLLSRSLISIVPINNC